MRRFRHHTVWHGPWCQTEYNELLQCWAISPAAEERGAGGEGGAEVEGVEGGAEEADDAEGDATMSQTVPGDLVDPVFDFPHYIKKNKFCKKKN